MRNTLIIQLKVDTSRFQVNFLDLKRVRICNILITQLKVELKVDISRFEVDGLDLMS